MPKKKTVEVEGFKLPTPQKIKAYLDQYVIGQDETKKILSVAVYNHYKRIVTQNTGRSKIEFDKSNILLTGPTGCGKTLLVKTIARLLNVPCYIQDCTKITASGYVGSDVEDCLVGLLRACNYNLEAAQQGIVMLDEVDKISKREAGPSIIRDVSGECVQQSLLKIIEGDLVGVPPAGGRKHPEQQLIYVDTRNILFIASGAFVGLEDIVMNRLGHASIGYDNVANQQHKCDNIREHINAEDIKNFGFIPEFVGRFPVITSVNPLTQQDLASILMEPKNSILKQYTELLALDNTQIEFDSSAVEEIAGIAASLGTGARALRSIVESFMTDIMYEAPENIGKAKPVKWKITRDFILAKTQKFVS